MSISELLPVDALSVLRRKAEASIPIRDGDYQKDGLWYCGKCNTPKECRIIGTGGENIVVRCLCECGSRKQEAAEAQKVIDQQEQNRARWMGPFARLTLAADDGKNPNMAFARRYIEKWDKISCENLSFTLSGGVGCGKTYAAAAIGNALISKGYRAFMDSTGRIVDYWMQYEQQDKLRDMLSRFDLVILDDFGAERGTDYAVQKVFDAIDIRMTAQRPLLLTTNLSVEQMQGGDLAASRIFSRLQGCATIRCKGGDLRKDAGVERRRAAAALLGGGE